jgi:hypothetical protein
MSDLHESSATPEQYAASPNAARSAGNADQPSARKSVRAPTAKAEKAETRLVTITIDADTARVVRVEGSDSTGARRELSDAERATLVKLGNGGRLEELVERAFEAGVACVLDGDSEADATTDSPEEAEISRRLLAPLIRRSAVRHLLDSAVLDRAILSTLVEHSPK